MRKQILRKVLLTVMGMGFISLFLFNSTPALATNPNLINFQGKVVNGTASGNTGTNVTDGTYAFRFCLYTTATPTTPCTAAANNDAIWKESKSLGVTSGIFQTELGDTTTLPDFSANANLYLGVTFSNDAAGEMTPRIHLDSVPYAKYSDNAGALSGLTASNFVQLAQGLQTDSSTTNASIAINKTNASGTPDILLLQKSSKNVLEVNNSGTVLLGQAGASGLNGTLTFNNGSGSNTVSLSLQANPASSYTLLLPTTGPSTSQCLQTDGTTANQLVFVACSGGGPTSVSYSITANTNGGSISGSVLTLAKADGTHPGLLSADAQTIGGVKTFKDGAAVGTIGTSTGQLYVGGTVPVDVSSGGAATGTSPRDVYIQGRYAYVVSASPSNKLQVFDISNPASPVDVSAGGVATGTDPLSIYVQGRYAYVINSSANKLQVFDVSNPASPTDVSAGGVTTGTNPSSVYVQGRYAYVTDSTTNKLQVFDVSNPASPTDVSGGGVTTGSDPFNIYVQGRYAYVVGYLANKLQVFDVSNPASPTDVSAGGVVTGAGPRSVYVQGRYAYVLDNNANKLQVFDVSNPASPTDVSGGGVTTGTSPSSIYVQDRYAYVVDPSVNKLQVFDISNPASPTDVSAGGVTTGTLPVSVYVQGRYAYVVDQSTSKLQVFDLGGAYTQQLQAGGAEVGTLQVSTNGQVAGDLNIQGGLSVGQSTEINGYLGISGLVTASTNSATGFVIKDSSSSKTVATFDTSGDQVVLGQSGASGLDGKLTFKNATGSGTASIVLTGNPTTNYTYQLPTGTVGSNQCLQSGTVSAGSVPLIFGSCGSGGGTFATTYSTTSQASNTIAYSNSGGGALILQNASTPLTTLFTIQNNAATFNYLTVTLASNIPHLQVYGASSTNYADIYYDAGSSTAFFKASSGTTQIGSGSGAVNITAGAAAAVAITGHANSTFTTDSGYVRLDGPSGVQLGTPSSNSGNLIFNYGSGAATAAITFAGNSNANYVYTLPSTVVSSNQCLQSGTLSGSSVPLTFGSCGSGSGTSLSVDGGAVGSTGNLQDTTGTTLVAATNFTNASGNITLTVAAAGTGASGIVTATGTQNFDGNKVFSGSVQVQNASGITIGTSSTAGVLALFNGTNTVSIQGASSTTAYTITLPSAVATGSNQCLASTGSNGILQWLPCGAGSTAAVTLTPEFPGAVMTGDTTNNTGTMTSDFCSNTVGSLPALTTGCNSGQTHNFYQWTANATNDYEIFVKWAAPSDFSSFSTFTFNGFRTSSSDAVTVTVYNAAGTSCGSGSIAGTVNTWNNNTSVSTASCSAPSPGDIMTIDAHLSVGVNNEFARMGEITITYNRN